MKNAIVLCSGGLDSVVTAHYVKKVLRYNHVAILFFNYGQRSYKAEKKSALRCAEELNGSFRKIRLDELRKLSVSLINIKETARKIKRNDLKDTKNESKKWYVPCRNLMFLSYALALIESNFIKDKRKRDIFVGFKNEGKENFPDTTKGFVNLMNRLSLKTTENKGRIIAPLIKKNKEDIILLGKKLGIDFKKTFSCYINEKVHCGVCLACRLRREGFYWANVTDPTRYLEK